MEPALLHVVPSDLQRLQTPAGLCDQVLLQRSHAEGVGHLEVGQLAVPAVGAHPKLAISLEEARRHALVTKLGAIEATQHSRRTRWSHRHGVVRALPLQGLVRVTLQTLIIGGVSRPRCGHRARRGA